MAWHIAGQMHEMCSCKFLCPCWFGPAEPDQGWCSGALVFDVQSGKADGLDLSARTVVFAADWPGDFWAGNGTARLYIDERATPEQRRALEGIFNGQSGGPMGPVSTALISKWLPSKTMPIEVNWGDQTTATVGDVGQLTSQRLKNEAGQPATVQGAAAMAAFNLERLEVARTAGSRWADPEMRRWEADSGTTGAFDWSA
jgi:hypothetical protein